MIQEELGALKDRHIRLTMDAQEATGKCHGLTKVEDQFRVMKSDLETRPIYADAPFCLFKWQYRRATEHWRDCD